MMMGFGMARMAMLLCAMLLGMLKLQGRVHDPVVCKLFLDCLFYVSGAVACDDVHGGIGAVSVHAPKMDVMNVLDPVELHQMMAKLIDVSTVRSFDQKQVDCFF